MQEYEFLSLINALAIALINATLLFILWYRDKKINKRDRTEKFYQQLINNFTNHNWKLLENLDKIENDLKMRETTELIGNPNDLATRIVLLDRLNFLFEVFLHKDLLEINEIESWASWTTSWFALSTKHLKVIFERGDLYPLSFILWIKNELLPNEKVEDVFGEILKIRLAKPRK